MVITVPLLDVLPGQILAVPVREGLTLAVCEYDGGWHAVDNRCPHRGAPLCDGALNGEWMVCPLHHFKFSLKTGRCFMPRHLMLKRFPVERVGDELRITVDEAAAAAPAGS